jgi:hypothetical protein
LVVQKDFAAGVVRDAVRTFPEGEGDGDGDGEGDTETVRPQSHSLVCPGAGSPPNDVLLQTTLLEKVLVIQAVPAPKRTVVGNLIAQVPFSSAHFTHVVSADASFA